MDIIVPTFLISFFITFSSIPIIIDFSNRKSLHDIPGGRKIHKGKIPSLGGIGIFLGFIISIFFWGNLSQIAELKYTYVGLLLIVFIGIRDDILPMSPTNKLIGELIAALIVVTFGDIRLTSFHGLLGLHEIPYIVSVIISVFTIIVITNAFNLIDGLDGLAGSMSLIALIVFGIWFYLFDDKPWVLIISSLAGAVLAFLKFNISPAQIFMGDTGALLIGFLCSTITISFIESSAALPEGSPYKINSPITFGIVGIIYPLYDTLRIFIFRLIQGKSPFSPDKSHIHHLIMRLGNTHTQTTVTLVLCSILIISTILLSHNLGDNLSVILLLALCFILGLILDIRISNSYPSKKIKNKLFKKK